MTCIISKPISNVCRAGAHVQMEAVVALMAKPPGASWVLCLVGRGSASRQPEVVLQCACPVLKGVQRLLTVVTPEFGMYGWGGL